MSDNELLSAISDMMDQKLDERLKPVNDRLDKIDDRLDKMDDRLDKMDDRLDKMDDRLNKMDDRLDKADDTLNTLKFSQEHITEKLKGIEVTMNYNDYHLSHDIKRLHEDLDTITEILKINNMIPIAK